MEEENLTITEERAQEPAPSPDIASVIGAPETFGAFQAGRAAPEFTQVATPRDVQRGVLRQALGTELGGPLADIYQKEAAATERVARGQLNQRIAEAGGVEGAQADYVRGLRGEYAAAETKLMAPPPTFNVTKDTEEGLMGLAAIMPLAGLIIGGKGQMAGINAMNAMAGALQGYQTGNKERIAFETKKYEEAWKQWQAQINQVKDSLARYEKLAAADLGAATAKAKAEALSQGHGIISDLIEQQGLTKTREIVEKLAITTAQANAKVTQSSRLVPVQTPEGPRLVTQEEAAEAARKGTPFTPAPRSTQAGQIALTMANRVYNNIEGASNDLVNIANSPAISQSPIFSGIINSDPNTVLKSLLALGLRQEAITKPEQRAFDQLSMQVGLALSRLEASGLANGSTAAQVKGFDSLKPKAGDHPINMALYLAKVRQEIETGIRVHSTMAGATAEQKAFAKEKLQDVQQAIPFTVKEVLDILNSGRGTLSDSSQKLLSQPGILGSANLSGSRTAIPGQPAQAPAPAEMNTAEDVKSAFKAGRISRDEATRILKEKFGYQ